MKANRIEDALAALAAGRMVVVVDDEDRENEGDLILAAEHATAENVGFMVRWSSGVICAALTGERLDALHLPQMVARNGDSMRTAYTVTVDFRHGTSTGNSADDRPGALRASLHPRAADAAWRVHAARLSRESRRPGTCRDGDGRARWRHRRAGARALGVPHRRSLRIDALRLPAAARRGDAAHRPRGAGRDRLP